LVFAEAEGTSRGMARARPSGLEGGPVIRLANRLRLDNAVAMARGSLIHAWLEQVAWLDDGPPDDDSLLAAARALGPLPCDATAELPSFREILARPGLASLLKRSAYRDSAALGLPAEIRQELLKADVELELLREHRFAVRNLEGVMQGSIDRCVLLNERGRIVAADIIDFKTDHATTPEDLDTRTEHYRPQLAAYRSALAATRGIDPARVCARLVFIEADLVKTV
jgi:ATP-dependent exoDNAse (exonuclease V) beta subunit